VRWVVALLIVMLLMGAAQVEAAIKLVKNTRNSEGQFCSMIPEVVAEKLGCRVVKAEWSEDKTDSSARVSLNVSTQKELLVDSLYMSYSWNPEWVWRVESQTQKVSPANAQAERWMKGKI
jgi:uncharacterized Fe-S cluster-containing MiaB family protein